MVGVVDTLPKCREVKVFVDMKGPMDAIIIIVWSASNERIAMNLFFVGTY